MPLSEYVCAGCGGTFWCDRTEEEKQRECQENFGWRPDEPNTPETAMLCDDCYQEFMRWRQSRSMPNKN